ncbi:MAG: PAS domain-containing protein [Chloroflexi bacterium]|nr:PAS domain-containing protein [Chloroflexota bacterium]
MDDRRVPVRVIGEAVRDAAGQIIRIQGALQDLTRIRSTEHALLRSQRRFQQFADAMPMIVWTSLPDGTLDFLSQSFYDYTGLNRAAVDLALREWIATVHPDDIESLVAAWPAAVAEGISYSLNFLIRRHDGGYRWHHTSARPVVEQDEVVRWIGSSIDVEDLLKAGHRAPEVADELTSTLNSMSEGFCTLDDKWRITFVNPAAESLLRRDRDDLIGRIIWRIFPEVRGTTAYDAFTEAVRTGERQTFDLFLDPLNSWFEAAAYPSSGRLAVHFRDVTLARQAEAAIRLNEERFRAIARATSDVVWDWDLSTDFIWWNDGMHGLFGFEQDALESTSESWTNRIHPDDAERVISGIRDAMDSPGDEWSSEYRFRRADGTYAYVVDRGVVIRDKFGIAVRMVGGMTDLTTQREAQAEVRRQAALLEQARDAILVFGVDGRISAWNGSAARAYGAPVERAVGRPASELDLNRPGRLPIRVRERSARWRVAGPSDAPRRGDPACPGGYRRVPVDSAPRRARCAGRGAGNPQ